MQICTFTLRKTLTYRLMLIFVFKLNFKYFVQFFTTTFKAHVPRGKNFIDSLID